MSYKSLMIYLITFLCFNFASAQKNKYVGNWNVKRYSSAIGILIILPNKKFEYYEKNNKIVEFSNGNWKVENNILILNSINSNECLYTSNFSNLCPEVMRNIKMKQINTIEGCIPKIGSKIFIEFQNEKFILKRGILTYLTQLDGNCKEGKVTHFKISK